MAGTPTTPRAAPPSPKLTLPPMTLSPQVTRLDRVLDLVTEHEAQFRETELRVVDVSTRVAALELALGGAGRDEGGGAPAPDVRAELENARAAIQRLHADRRADRDAVDARVDALERAFAERVRRVEEGCRAVLRDVLAKVATELDRARVGEFERAKRYATNAELAALEERVASREALDEANRRDALRKIDDLGADRDKTKRRMAKLIAQYNAGLRASRRAGAAAADDDDGPSFAALDTTASAVSEPPERVNALRQHRRLESPPRTRPLSRAPNANNPNHHKPLAPGTSVVEPGLLRMGPRGAYAGAALASDAGFEIPGRIERAGMVAEEAAERFDAFLERMKTAAVGGADADDADAGYQYSDDEDEGKRPTVIGDELAAGVEAPGGAAEGNEAIDR